MLKSLPRAILPITTSTNQLEHLTLGGCDTVDLATEFGTPLYIFDEKTLRHSCREFRAEFQGRYPASSIAYASKAYLGRALAALLAEEGMDLDVVSGGELSIAISVGFPPERIHFHGNNKSEEELAQALDYGVGRIVVDNFREIKLLSKVATALNTDQKVLLRLTPGVDPRTHVYTSTGITDSKFGFPMLDGQAESALQRTINTPNLEPMGLHIHLGSPIFSVEPTVGASKSRWNLPRRCAKSTDFSCWISVPVAVLQFSTWKHKRLPQLPSTQTQSSPQLTRA